MTSRFVHNLLTQLDDSERMSIFEDRLSKVIKDTFLKVQDDQMLSDDELEYVAAAQKEDGTEGKELFRMKKDK